MTAQTAPLEFSTYILRGAPGSGLWRLKTTQHTLAGGIQYAEYRYATRAEAVVEAVRLAFNFKKTVAEWEITARQKSYEAELEQLYTQRIARIGLSDEAQANANDYLARNPLLRAELGALFGNWTNKI